jgi:TonB family protein
MNAYLNYLLEASIGLCLFLLVYQLFLRKETSFRLNRIFLLVAIIASVTFPLLKLNTVNSPVPSLNFSVEPASTELVYSEDSIAEESYSTFTTWEILAGLYLTGLIIFLIVFTIRLTGMLKALKRAAAYTLNNHRIVELKSQDSPFSFFNYIFIGSTPPLTEKEKQQIIAHESIHARLYHSFDILLLNILGIVFWFNPVIRIYKKIFVQLHEFEADARAVSTHDVDEYCSLLAKVALHSADYKIANHFSNSLTLKRIEMMRTLKQKIKSWKVIAVAMVIPVVFFVVSCQDQVESPKYILREQPLSGEDTYKEPQQIQDRINALNKANPDKNYIAVELSNFPIDTEKGRIAFKESIKKNNLPEVVEFQLEDVKDPKAPNGLRRFAIFDLNQKNDTKEEVTFEEPEFTAVEMSAEFPNGINAMNNFIKSNVRYPEGAKRIGLSGRVYIQFTVNKNGSLSDFTFIKGISKELDEEALRVIKLMPDWKPAQQNGKPVNSRFVLPIPFGSGNSTTSEDIQEVTSSLLVEYSKKISGDKIVVSGTVADSNGKPLPGANVIVVGGTSGTSTDSEGNFKLTVPVNTKKLEASFKGFKSTALQL